MELQRPARVRTRTAICCPASRAARAAWLWQPAEAQRTRRGQIFSSSSWICWSAATERRLLPELTKVRLEKNTRVQSTSGWEWWESGEVVLMLVLGLYYYYYYYYYN